jgi:hypothetical protein
MTLLDLGKEGKQKEKSPLIPLLLSGILVKGEKKKIKASPFEKGRRERDFIFPSPVI